MADVAESDQEEPPSKPFTMISYPLENHDLTQTDGAPPPVSSAVVAAADQGSGSGAAAASGLLSPSGVALGSHRA